MTGKNIFEVVRDIFFRVLDFILKYSFLGMQKLNGYLASFSKVVYKLVQKYKFPAMNKINRIVSNIRNNAFSNAIKDLFMGWSDIPVVAYTDATNDYVSAFEVSTDANGITNATITLASSPTHAKDYSSLWWFQKNSELKLINKAFNTDPDGRVFRWKRVIVYTGTKSNN